MHTLKLHAARCVVGVLLVTACTPKAPAEAPAATHVEGILNFHGADFSFGATTGRVAGTCARKGENGAYARLEPQVIPSGDARPAEEIKSLTFETRDLASGTTGTNQFRLVAELVGEPSLPQTEMVQRQFVLDPVNGEGSGTARSSGTAPNFHLQVSGKTTDGPDAIMINVTISCYP